MFKKKKAKQSERTLRQGRLQQLLQLRQRKLANWLQQKSERLSLRSKKFLFALLLVLSAAINTYLIIESFFPKDKPERQPLSGGIILPKLPKYNSEANSVTDSMTLYRIEEFTAYWDSLSETACGVRFQDSLLKARPGLIDSILLWTQIKKGNDEKK